MVEGAIFDYGMRVSDDFARRAEEVQAFEKTYSVPLSGARAVALRAKVLDFIPRYSALQLLLGFFQKKVWARIEVPKNYHTQRLRPSYVAPSLGSVENVEATITKLETFLTTQTDPQVVDKGTVIVRLLREGVLDTNKMVDFVIAHMYQFVQA